MPFSWPDTSFDLVEHLLEHERYGTWARPPVRRGAHLSGGNTAVFLSLVDRSDPVGCWPWTGPRLPSGYGFMPFRSGIILAHRYALEMLGGPLVAPVWALHHCDNPPCVRVGDEHLFRGTAKENVADAQAKGRRRKAA